MEDIQEKNQQMQKNTQEIFDASSSVSQAFMYFIDSWKKYFLFSGRANRTMFWAFIIFNIIIGSFFALIVGKQGAVVYFFLSFFPAWAAAVRRLHDIGQTGVWTVIPAILILSACFFIKEQSFSLVTLCSSLSLIFCFLLLFFLCMKSDEENKYGSEVK